MKLSLASLDRVEPVPVARWIRELNLCNRRNLRTIPFLLFLGGCLLAVCSLLSGTFMLVVFIGMTLLAALTPGLAVLLVTSSALKKGFGDAWQATVGIEIGNTVYVLASATGLTALLVTCAPLFTAVRWLGAAYLITGGFFIAMGLLLGTKNADA
jgi:LysE type translocator